LTANIFDAVWFVYLVSANRAEEDVGLILDSKPPECEGLIDEAEIITTGRALL
jgi:hypothetical protein